MASVVVTGCSASVLANVTLLIHCRQNSTICEMRHPMLDLYSKYFREVIFLSKDVSESKRRVVPCSGAGDPHWCIASQMNSTKARGIMYMQFDVVISPCGLASMLKTDMLASFSDSTKTYAPFCYYETCRLFPSLNCDWFHWQGKTTQDQVVNVVNDLESVLFSGSREWTTRRARVFKKLREGMMQGSSDLIYVPREAFQVFTACARVFKTHGVFHEIVHPTMLELVPFLTRISFQDLACHGSRVREVYEAELLSKDFLCGHRVNYSSGSSLKAVRILLNQTLEVLPTEHQASSEVRALDVPLSLDFSTESMTSQLVAAGAVFFLISVKLFQMLKKRSAKFHKNLVEIL